MSRFAPSAVRATRVCAPRCCAASRAPRRSTGLLRNRELAQAAKTLPLKPAWNNQRGGGRAGAQPPVRCGRA